MKFSFRPLTSELLPACIEFNRRLREKTDAYFTLPEELHTTRPEGAVQSSYWLAVDETETVRGGVLLQDQRGWIENREAPLTNIQSPITEGIFNRAYAGVAFHLLRFLEARTPYLYAVGMGSADAPFARLLKAGGWDVTPNPFYVSLERAGRVLSGLPILRGGRKGLAAAVLAKTGLADAGSVLWRLSKRLSPDSSIELAGVDGWHDADLDRIWRQCRDEMAFCSVRDAAGVAGLHPASQPRLLRYAFKEGGTVTGWSIARLTNMHNSPHFGNLRVGTILDALVYPAGRLTELLALTRRELRRAGADMVVANQCHASWDGPLRRIGFIERPSNYMLAMSKPLRSVAIAGSGRVYVTRADGDGRLNL